MQQLLTIDQVAESLQVSTRTVRRLVESGRLPHIRVGRQIRVSPEILDEYLADQTVGAVHLGEVA